jgi:hypothetical protein
MFSTAEKSSATTQVQRHKAAGDFFFRKTADETFFGAERGKPFFGAPVQAQLEVSHPEDPQEKEADAVADTVMRMAEPAAEAPPPEEEKKEEIQRAAEPEKEVEQEVRRSVMHSRAAAFGLIHRRIHRQAGMGGFASHGRTEEDSDGPAVQAMLYRQAGNEARSARGPPSTSDATSPSESFQQSLSSSRGSGSALQLETRNQTCGHTPAGIISENLHIGIPHGLLPLTGTTDDSKDGA